MRGNSILLSSGRTLTDKKKFFNKSSKATDRFLIETVHLVLLGVGYSLSATSLTCVATLSS